MRPRMQDSSRPSQKPTLVVGSDHAGFALKSRLKAALVADGFRVIDVGTSDGTTSVDYPDYARAAAAKVVSGEARFGVVVCGTGIGISIAANRDPRIRCALVHDTTTAHLAREHNDANMIAFGGRIIAEDVALDALRAFLAAKYEGGRHAKRVAKLGMPLGEQLEPIG